MRHSAGPRAAILAAAALATACASGPRQGHANLDATLWMRTSAEYRSAAMQTYAGARRQLAEALLDTTWTAALEQSAGYGSLPAAVILDVDETVLDNSAYQARLIAAGAAYDSENWAEWVREEAAPAVPGAVEFTRSAARVGVTVVYVTNRDHDLESATRSNLLREGFPLNPDIDPVLMRGEREGWGTDKGTRRAEVARSFRVLMVVGDDLNDFVSGARGARDTRQALVDRYQEFWGTRWFVLPNPAYGSWEGSLLGFDRALAERERVRRKYDSLKPQPRR